MRKSLFFFIALMLFTALNLSCKTSEPAASDTLAVFQQTSHLLDLLYQDNYEAVNLIYWDDFYFNDHDVTEDYWDAYDEYEEDDFAESVVDEISSELHYKGENDPYQMTSLSHSDKRWTTLWENSQKSLEVTVEKFGNQYLLVDLRIAAKAD
ncbi:MAG TPA: hypothetical protein PLF50_06405 [Candidatus Cloacimonadota bacterium]|nr:hypothetical protein [Candidatus Cloacimonadota bacterium]HOV17102.1 hypothetical protein [Candidatus Cloacimonadota bacterium]HQL15357.1 hypothetical protein [Candidatus Cloacimonadota bacterium]